MLQYGHNGQLFDQKEEETTSFYPRKKEKILVHSVKNGETFQWLKARPLVKQMKIYFQGPPYRSKINSMKGL